MKDARQRRLAPCPPTGVSTGQPSPEFTPAKLCSVLTITAKDLGLKGRDDIFGAGPADAYAALTADDAPLAQTVPLPVERVSTGR